MEVVGHNLDIRIPDIDSRLEDGYLLVRKLGSLEPSDEFFGLAGEHGAADHLNAAHSLVVF